MKTIKSLIFLLLFTVYQINGQNSEDCQISPRIHSINGCSIKLNQLKQNQIEQYQKYCSNLKSHNLSEYNYFKNNTTIENYLLEKYPVNFKQIETGFEFINNEQKSIKFQKITEDLKESQDYKFIAKKNNFIIIKLNTYENTNYTIIDLEKFNSWVLPGNPIFTNYNVVYAYTNYYDEGILKIIDIERKKDITLSFEHQILNVKYSNNDSMGLLIEFENKNCNENQFLNILQQ